MKLSKTLVAIIFSALIIFTILINAQDQKIEQSNTEQLEKRISALEKRVLQLELKLKADERVRIIPSDK
jgi:hypothetical protein